MDQHDLKHNGGTAERGGTLATASAIPSVIRVGPQPVPEPIDGPLISQRCRVDCLQRSG